MIMYFETTEKTEFNSIDEYKNDKLGVLRYSTVVDSIQFLDLGNKNC